MVISFLGVRTDGRTDRRTDGQTRFWNPHMETCRHTKNFNSKLKISGEPSIPTCLPGGRGCITTQNIALRIGTGSTKFTPS